MIGQTLPQLPTPSPGDRVCFMGNTGEGKSIAGISLMLSQPDVIMINSKHDPSFNVVGVPVEKDEAIMRVGEGRYVWYPSDDWLADPEKQDRFFTWALKAGNRVIDIDEINDLCPSAQVYSRKLQKCVKQGRWRKLGIWGGAQEPVRCPSFFYGQSQHCYLFYCGWDPHRKAAESWFQTRIPWEMIPERSHKFLLKTPEGIFGPMKLGL